MKSSCKHILYYKSDCIWLQMGITMEYNRTKEGTGQVTKEGTGGGRREGAGEDKDEQGEVGEDGEDA